MAADPRIETYFAKARHWPDELRALREILRGAGLEETFKWRGPCYVAEGGNIATIWGFRDAPAIGFFKGVLLPDPEGLLQPAGENSRVVRVIRFRDGAEIAARTGALRSLIAAAVSVEKAGLKPDLPKDDFALPPELVDRFDADPAFQAAFAALTPGRQRGYALHFAGAKQSATRAARIEKHAARILAGKGLQDR